MTGPAGTQMDHWDRPLPLAIMPKSGPLPLMVSLLDANRALIDKLPKGYLKRSHWLKAGQALVTAAETGQPRDIELAFDAIVDALVREGWLKRSIAIPEPLRADWPRFGLPRFEPPRFEPPRPERPGFQPPRSEPPRPERPGFQPPRSEPLCSEWPRSTPLHNVRRSDANIAPRRAAEPLWRRIDPVGTNRQTAEGEQRASGSFKPGPKDLEQFVREYLLFL
jgi:hypothetical protein